MSDFNDFLKVIAEAKAKDPKQQKLKEVRENVKSDLSELFGQLASVSSTKVEEPVVEIIESHSEEIVEEIIQEQVPEIKPEEELQSDVLKLLKKTDDPQTHSFQQPQVDAVAKDLKAVTDKLKMMEQWLGKIAATGPGGGAGEIYNLDMPTKVVTGDYEINRKDYYIGVNADVKTYITLPTINRNLKDGRVVVIKDESGHAQLTPIKIIGTIDNDPNGAEIRINNGAIQLLYRNGSWRII